MSSIALTKAIRIALGGEVGTGNCTVPEVDIYPPGTTFGSYVSYWDMMEQINWDIWLNDDTNTINEDTPLGRFDDRASPPAGGLVYPQSGSKSLVYYTNAGGLRVSPNTRYPCQYLFSGLSSNSWVQTHVESTYGSLEGDFTLVMQLRATNNNAPSGTPWFLVGCYASIASAEREWALYIDTAGTLRFQYFLIASGMKTPTGGIALFHLVTGYGTLIVTRDDSENTNAIKFKYIDENGVETIAYADSLIGAKLINHTEFRMRNSVADFTYSPFEILNYAQVGRILTDDEQLAIVEFNRYGKAKTNPKDILTYYDSRAYRAGVMNYLTFAQDDASIVIPDETKQWAGLTLAGAVDTSSNTYPLALPSTIGGTGQKISNLAGFYNNQFAAPYWDFAWFHSYHIEVMIAGVNSSNGHNRLIMEKWGDTDNEKYQKLYLTAANTLEMTVMHSSLTVDAPVETTVHTLLDSVGEGALLFADDDWHVLRMQIWSGGIAIWIDNIYVSRQNQITMGRAPVNAKYGYDTLTNDTPFVMGNINNYIAIGLDTLAVYDNFNGTVGTDLDAHTPDTDVVGTGWTVSAVDMIELDGLGSVKFNAAAQIAFIDVGHTDVIVDMTWNPGGVDNRMAIYFRCDVADDATATCYDIILQTDANSLGNVYVRKHIAGVVTAIESVIPLGGLDLNADLVITAGIVGSTISYSIDGIVIWSGTDTEITTGTLIAIRHNNYVDGNARWKELTAGKAVVVPGTEIWSLGIAHLSFTIMYGWGNQENSTNSFTSTTANPNQNSNTLTDFYRSQSMIARGVFDDNAGNFAAAILNPITSGRATWSWMFYDEQGIVCDGVDALDLDLQYGKTVETAGYLVPAWKYSGRLGIQFDGAITSSITDVDAIGTRVIGDFTGTEFTIVLEFGVDVLSSNAMFISRYKDTGKCWYFRMVNSDTIQFVIFESDGVTARSGSINMASAGISADSAWHLIVIQMRATELEIRVDGVQRSLTDTSSWSGIWNNSLNTGFRMNGSDNALYLIEAKLNSVNIWDSVALQPTTCEIERMEQMWLYNELTPSTGLIEHQVSFAKTHYIEIFNSQPYLSPELVPIVQNGSGNFSYLWSKVSGTTLELNNGATQAIMRVAGQTYRDETTDVFKVEVTDIDNGNLVKEATVTFIINWDIV